MTLTMKKIVRIAREYLEYFPEWAVSDTIGALIRVKTPVLQGVLFDRSSSDDYRPLLFVSILSAPRKDLAYELPSYLRRPNGSRWIVEVSKRRHDAMSQHEREFSSIVRALHAQILPRYDEPLCIHEVLAIYEAEASTRQNCTEAYSLAALNAYLGHYERAQYWCVQYRAQSPEVGRTDWEIEQLRFLEELQGWLSNGIVNLQLDEIVSKQLQQLALPQ